MELKAYGFIFLRNKASLSNMQYKTVIYEIKFVRIRISSYIETLVNNDEMAIKRH
jgi:hypothetical protein